MLVLEMFSQLSLCDILVAQGAAGRVVIIVPVALHGLLATEGAETNFALIFLLELFVVLEVRLQKRLVPKHLAT